MFSVLLGVAMTAGCGEDTPSHADSNGSGGVDLTAGSGTDSGQTGGESQGQSDSVAEGTDSGGNTSSASASDSNSASDTDASGNDSNPIKFDLGIIPDAGQNQGACQPGGVGEGNGEPDFSYLWAANSTQGTISKIDTQTVTEVGRYYTRPDSAGSPSRTSVSLSGHVAVANRSGDITKIWATEEFCQDTNGTPGIQTSTDNVALAWDQEECRAWHLPFDYDSQRPVAWAPGTWNTTSCTWENEMLWTAGRYGSTQTEVILIDGDAGIVIDTVAIPGLKGDAYGLYGGAVDAEGNFWTTGWASGNQLVRVDIDDMSYQVWDGPSSTGTTSHWYGMTVDVNGYVWNCASRVARFDPTTETWTVSPELPQWNAGCMADNDPDGLLWLGGNGALGIDRETFEVVHQWPTGSSYGISVDFYGYVWTVNGNGAHRVDPETGDVTSYTGLVGAYTYSDMTGYALSTVGGGAPSG